MKVIKKGNVYRQECPNCGCVYEYTEKDVAEDTTTKCPECGEVNNHTRENKWN